MITNRTTLVHSPMCLHGVVNSKLTFNVNLLYSAVFTFLNVKPKYLEKARLNVNSSIINPTWPDLGSNPSSHGGMRAFIVIAILFRVLNNRRNTAVANSHFPNVCDTVQCRQDFNFPGTQLPNEMGYCTLQPEPCYYHYYPQASRKYYYEHDNICGMTMNAI
jgi:hypothetical protein